MSSCEKCWIDAARNMTGSQPEEYHRLLNDPSRPPCTPEQQAGPDASECPNCKRWTLHQITHEPMCGCDANLTKADK